MHFILLDQHLWKTLKLQSRNHLEITKYVETHYVTTKEISVKYLTWVIGLENDNIIH